MFNAGVYADARARFGERSWRAVAFVDTRAAWYRKTIR